MRVLALLLALLAPGDAKAGEPTDASFWTPALEIVRKQLPPVITREKAAPWVLGAGAMVLVQGLLVLGLARRRRAAVESPEATPVPARGPARATRTIAAFGGGAGSSESVESRIARLTQEHEESLKKVSEGTRRKATRLSTFFLRIQRMLKAETKAEFFQCFAEAAINGFGVSRVAFWLIDRQGTRLYPKLFGMKAKDAAGVTGVGELDAPAARELQVVPGDDNIVAWCAKHRSATTMERAARDTSLQHLISDRNAFNQADPVQTTAVMPVLVHDRRTEEERLVGVIALGPPTEAGSWSESENNLLQAFSTMTGAALSHADLLELSATELASSQEQSAREREQRRQMRAVLDRVVSPRIAEQLVTRPDSLGFEGEMVEATVFFSDVKGFTRYSESRHPREVVKILNQYLSEMSEIVHEHDGTLDKFVGDEIMAFWGALPRTPDHALRALRAAWKMRQVLTRLQDRWRDEGQEPLDVGMGLATGPMLFGGIGSHRKVDITVMGDTVNLGARIQTLTRDFDHDLIVSEGTYLAAREHVDAEILGQVELKGKSIKATVYGVTAVR